MTPSGSRSTRDDLVDLASVFAVFSLARWGARVLGVALGGPLSTVAALGAVALVTRRRDLGLPSLGLDRPRPWPRAFAVFLVAFAATALSALLLLPRLQDLLGAPAPSGRFDYLQGDLVALLVSIVAIAWFAAAFGEEVVMRGFAIPRLARVFGDGRLGWLAAVLVQAIAFGLLHHSAAGAIVAAVIGAAYGLLFWLGIRNLWPLIVAHAIPDTISFLGIFQGG